MRFPSAAFAPRLGLLLALAPAAILAPLAAGAQGTEPPADLRSLFAHGFLLGDTNGDGHVDEVHARLVVAEGAGAAGVVAAANLGARLGFESYATDLGLLVPVAEGEDAARAGHPLVVVGRAASLLGGLGIDPDAALADLVAGEGAVVRLPAGPGLPAGGVWVAGADDTGLLAAAAWLAGRYPELWVAGGQTFEGLASALDGRLARGGSEPEAPPAEPADSTGAALADTTAAAEAATTPLARPALASLDRVVVSSARPGVARLAVTVRAPTEEALERARAALDLDAGAGSLVGAGLHRIDVRLEGPGGVLTHPGDARVRLVSERPWSEEGLRPWPARNVADLTLSEFYTTSGIYRDTNEDLLPDRTEAVISVAPSAAGAQGPDARALVDLATRIGHEATGIRLPLVHLTGASDAPETLGFPVLYGVGHDAIDRLRGEGALGTVAEGTAPLPAGTGFLEFVTEALGDDDRSALVVGGADAAGLAAAGRLLAHRIPWLHEPGPESHAMGRHGLGRHGLAEVETEVRRFFQARGFRGQVALALVKLEAWLDRLEAGERPGVAPSDEAGEAGGAWRPDTPLTGLRVELAVDTVPEGLQELVEARVAARFPGLPVEVVAEASAFGSGTGIHEIERDFPWEVDEAWAALRAEVIPALAPGAEGRIELRLSEPPEVRAELARALRDTVAARGARVEVVVLSAWKQGFSWIEEEVIPALQELAPTRIEIDYRHLDESDEVRWQVMGSPTRFLQELYPVEAVLARELGVAEDSVVFRGDRALDATYRVRALDAGGAVVLERSFDARYRVLPYFGVHPDYERVRVSTGWLRAEVAGAVVADQRLATDLDHFWAFWQDEVQPDLRSYLLDLHEGRLTGQTAPFFDELRVEVRLSEPNHRIGIDEEVHSSLESLHNDLYFTSLAFLSHLGDHYGAGGLSYPGRILPWIDPSGTGAPGRARVTLTGRRKASAELVLRVATDAGVVAEAPRWRYPLSPLPTEAPSLRGAAVRAGTGPDDLQVERLLFDVVALDSVGRFEEHRERASEGQIDRTFLPVELLEGMVDQVRALHGQGMLGDALAFEGVGELAFRFGVERADEFTRQVTLPVSGAPAPTRHPELVAQGFRWEEARAQAEAGGEPLVQWSTPIGPAEHDTLLARIGAFPEAHTYHVGTSFLGQPLWAADFLPPVSGRYRSRAKLTALRPTIFLSGRQHANEVSSTSHLLRLGELLVTDPEYRALLARVNVVLNPLLNADGAQLAWEMQQVNPDFTLHAGYLGALGVDVTSGGGSDPLYEESQVRPAIMAAWLPDIFLNLHGYPSHEWVQHVSGYAAWVRGRTVTQRAWWAPRGWFVPGFSWVDDPDHPEIREAQTAILDAMAASITSLPEVEALNRRQYARYARYGRQDVEGFREDFHEGMLVYRSLRGREATGQGPGNPRILTFSATTEAPDETARGAWLELVASAGLAHTTALLRYLAEGEPRVEWKTEGFEGGVTRTVSRRRPVLPPGEDPPGDDPPDDDPPG
jgi:hypothetical protein